MITSNMHRNVYILKYAQAQNLTKSTNENIFASKALTIYK